MSAHGQRIRRKRSARLDLTPQRAARFDSGAIQSERLLALFAATDLDRVIDSTFQLLAATVPCDFVSAFYQRSDDGLLKERDSRGRTYGHAFMRRYVELTPALPFARANRGVKLLRTQKLLPGSLVSLRASAFYREVMRPQGWRHGAALCFWGQPAGMLPLLVAAVYRSEGQPDFSDEEATRLERIHPFIDCAVNRLAERDLYRSVQEGMAMVIADESRGLAILSKDLEAVQVTAVARLRCTAWLNAPSQTPDPSSTWRLPAVLASTCHDLLHEWEALLRADLLRQAPFGAAPLHPTTPELTASVTLVPATGLSDPTFVIEFHVHTDVAPVGSTNQALKLLQRLTPAERAVAIVTAEGCSNQELADRLGKSVHAVKFLLHKIYQKSGVPGRAALVAALGSNRIRPDLVPSDRDGRRSAPMTDRPEAPALARDAECDSPRCQSDACGQGSLGCFAEKGSFPLFSYAIAERTVPGSFPSRSSGSRRRSSPSTPG